jgi:hypothetical protein
MAAVNNIKNVLCHILLFFETALNDSKSVFVSYNLMNCKKNTELSCIISDTKLLLFYQKFLKDAGNSMYTVHRH